MKERNTEQFITIRPVSSRSRHKRFQIRLQFRMDNIGNLGWKISELARRIIAWDVGLILFMISPRPDAQVVYWVVKKPPA